MADNLKALILLKNTVLDPSGGVDSVLVADHNNLEEEEIRKIGKYTGFQFLSKRSPVSGVVPYGSLFWDTTPMNAVVPFLLTLSAVTLDGNEIKKVLDTIGINSLIHFKDFVGRSTTLKYLGYTEDVDTASNPIFLVSVVGFAENTDYTYQVGEEEVCMIEFISSGNVVQNYAYADLFDLASNSLLVPGQFYRITDFETIYDRPDFDSLGAPKSIGSLVTVSTGIIEPLLLRAFSTDDFERQVRSLINPSDYIEYDIQFTNTEKKGNAAKGRITKRIDTVRQIECDFDWRTVMFKRYETSTGSGFFTEFKDNGEASQLFKAVDTANTVWNINLGTVRKVGGFSGRFILNNVVLLETAIGVSLGEDNINMTFGDNIQEFKAGDFNNKIKTGDNCAYITIGNVNSNLTFGTGCNTQTFGHSNGVTVFGNNCVGQRVGDGNGHLVFGDDCKYQTIGSMNDDLTFGDTCEGQKIGDQNHLLSFGDMTNSCTIGDKNDTITVTSAGGGSAGINMKDFNTNIEVNESTYVNFGSECDSIIVPNGSKNLNFKDKIVSVDFTGNTDVSSGASIDVFLDFAGANKYSYVDGSGVFTVLTP